MTTVNNLLSALTFFAALGSGIMAGLFFVFSNFVMKALSGLPPDKGIAAMQSINVAILNPLFLAIFLGTAAACLPIMIFALARWHDAASAYLLVGSVLYLVGAVLVTIVFNVPRNDALAAIDPGSAAGASVWRDYLAYWTTWNHVRTITALAAAASLIIALRQLRIPVS